MNNPPTTAEKLLVSAIVLGVLHHVDHVLRADHVGWPAKADVTPFTFSLLVYVLFAAILLLRRRPWWRVGFTAVVFVATQTAHIFAETPSDQYDTWADGVSSFPDALGQPNLLGVASAPLGVAAVIVSILLSLALVAALVAFTREALEQRSAGLEGSSRRSR